VKINQDKKTEKVSLKQTDLNSGKAMNVLCKMNLGR